MASGLYKVQGVYRALVQDDNASCFVLEYWEVQGLGFKTLKSVEAMSAQGSRLNA